MFIFNKIGTFYRPQRSWGKVIFLHPSVILFTGGGVWHTRPPGQTLLRADTPPGQCMLGYGQQAGGTHRTGMHSCFYYIDPLNLLQHTEHPHSLMTSSHQALHLPSTTTHYQQHTHPHHYHYHHHSHQYLHHHPSSPPTLQSSPQYAMRRRSPSTPVSPIRSFSQIEVKNI